MNKRRSASGLSVRTRHRASLIAVLTLPLSLMNAPAIAQGPTPSPTPTTQAGATANPTLKAAWDKAATSGKPVEIPERFTETMKVWANPDGKNLRAELYTRPVQLKNKTSGAWEPIDTRIVTRDGKLQATRVKTPLTFGGRGTKQMVLADGEQGTSGMQASHALPEPKVSGNTVTYPDAVAPGADLVVQAQADGFISQVVFRQRPTGPVTVRLPLTLPEGTAFGKTPQGLPQLKDAKGKAAAAPIVLTAMDANVESSPDEGRTSAVDARVETSSKTSELVFTPDEKFLADPAVTYPVTIAAASEWFGGGVPTDAWVNQKDPSSNHAAEGWLRAGTTSTDTARVYLKFNTDAPELDGATVLDADLWVWNYKSGGPNGQLCGDNVGNGIAAERITSSWTTSALSWSNQPTTLGTLEGGNKAGYNYTADPSSWCAKEETLLHQVNAMAREWIENDRPNHGLVLRALPETATINWRQYYSSEYSGDPYPGFRHPPTLMIEYTPVPREVKGIFMPYQDTDPTGAEIDANTSTSTSVQTGPEVSGEEATAMRANSPGYYMEDTTYGTWMPDDVDSEQEWLDLIDAVYPNDGPYPTPTPTPDPDTTPPTVISSLPSNGAVDAPTSTSVSATFDEVVTGAAMVVKLPGGAPAAGTTAMDTTGKILTFVPQSPLTADTVHTVEVTGAKDAAGNTMALYSWSFTTETAPQGHWRFNEGSGDTAADTSGHGHDASLGKSTMWTAGRNGNAVTNVPATASKTSDSAAREMSARERLSASQEAKKQGKPVEVRYDTTEVSTTRAMPDGSFETQITTTPVRTKQDGLWVPIDVTLVERDGLLKPKATRAGTLVELSKGGTAPYLKMVRDGGQVSALSWPTALPTPSVKRNVATYVDAAGPGADLVITVLPTGIRQEVVMHKAPAKSLELRIALQSSDLTLSRGKNGTLLLKSSDRAVSTLQSRPFMRDDSVKGARAKRVGVNAEVVDKDGEAELVLKPDQAFLTDSDTTYPVRLDAAVTLPISADVDVSTYDTDSPAYSDNEYLMAGTMADGFIARTHLKFETTGLLDSTVTGAMLSMNTVDSHNCGPALARGIQVARLTDAWDPDNMYWGSTPTHTAEDASTNFKGVNSDCSTWPDSMDWNVTGIAQDWAAGAANHGLVLKSPGEANVNNYRMFTSSEYPDADGSPPTLTITTSGPASEPTVSAPTITPAQTVDGTTVTTSLTPQLAATVADTIGGDLTGEFEVEHDPTAAEQGTGQIWAGSSLSVTSGGRASVTVPTGELANGWMVRWRARAVNAAASTASAWSAWQAATVEVGDTSVAPLAQSAGPVLRTDQSFTVAAWLRWNDKDGAYRVLEQRGSNAASFSIGNDPDHGLIFKLTQADENEATIEGALSGVEPPVNEWFHLAGVYDAAANKVTLYLNGTEVKTAQLGFPAWNAVGPLQLGAAMVGDLDEVLVYQKAASAAQIGAIYAAIRNQPATRSASVEEKTATVNATAARKKFPYGHISTDRCQQIPPQRPSAVANSGPFSLCYSYLVGERDIKGVPGAQWEAGRWTAQMVIAVHSYVGHKYTNANATKARASDVPIGRSLGSRQIRMQIKMGPVKATGSMLDDWDDRWMRVFAGPTGCTSDQPDGIHDEVGDWADGNIREIILDRSGDDNAPDPDKISSCSINPNVRYTTHAMWVREDLGKRHTFRCDSSMEFKANMGGCVLTTLRPVLIFDENYSAGVFHAQHVWTALYNSQITYPKVGSGSPKKIPGGFMPYQPSCAFTCLRRTTKDDVEKANRDIAIPECKKIRDYVKPDSCDEYPFATTYEGAGGRNTGYNYSVAIIPGPDNCSQGGAMRMWYERNRVLDLDSYWVDVIRQGQGTPHSGAPGMVAAHPAPDNMNLATCTIDGVS
ncbi:hypothetical protein GCM10009850_111260 [Nonomuraea monospora]|uniref:LamG-like jellyroll fold domain-containing protein n=1 Tax=Nonomuraea monospora TaxID=568818 RepID=A0ABP5PXD4_9ACTN